jgi:hypothetical protein
MMMKLLTLLYARGPAALATSCLDATTEACCSSRNPLLQLTYLALWSGGYALYWQHVFLLLPASGVPTHHL